jgi:hypothetical protein
MKAPIDFVFWARENVDADRPMGIGVTNRTVLEMAEKIAELEAKLATAVGGSAWFETIRAQVVTALRAEVKEAFRSVFSAAVSILAEIAELEAMLSRESPPPSDGRHE